MKTFATRFVRNAVCCALALTSLPSLVHAQSCVAGIRASNPSSVYVADLVNGTVTDTRTALMWDRCPHGLTGAACAGGTLGDYLWPEALDSAGTANSTNYKGYSDWRLPNIKELNSLVEECRVNPSINEWAFPATPTYFFWSSSPDATRTTHARYVHFGDGGSNYLTRGWYAHVRLVRAGQ
jgi:Protein of unknown function (DUF1566)